MGWLNNNIEYHDGADTLRISNEGPTITGFSVNDGHVVLMEQKDLDKLVGFLIERQK